jgi:hypothetical protein
MPGRAGQQLLKQPAEVRHFPAAIPLATRITARAIGYCSAWQGSEAKAFQQHV